jgi:hypothetical protein
MEESETVNRQTHKCAVRFAQRYHGAIDDNKQSLNWSGAESGMPAIRATSFSAIGSDHLYFEQCGGSAERAVFAG